MKLTKVLVGLLAISLCGMATAAKKDYGNYLSALTKAMNAAKGEITHDVQKAYNEFRAYVGDDESMLRSFEGAVRSLAKRDDTKIETLRTAYRSYKPTELKKTDTTKPSEEKGEWRWGDRPDWEAGDTLSDYANNAALGNSITDKTWKEKIIYAFTNKKFDSFLKDEDLKSTVEDFNKNAKIISELK